MNPAGERGRYWIALLVVLAASAAILYLMDRPFVAPSGEVRLWAGEVQSADNSQHLADWYTPSHVVHGLLFYFLGWLLLRHRPVGERFTLALLIEAGWEIVENTRWVIDRYREATIAFGYEGDSIVNSLADIGWMALGFLLASRLPVWGAVLLGVGLELLALAAIRDNLTLNVMMLVAPQEAILAWQAGG